MQFRRYLLIVVGCALSCAAMAEQASVSAAVTKNQFTSPKKTILVKSESPTVTIKLKANPSTGYSWFLGSYDHDCLQPVSSRFIPAKGNRVGAGGVSEWTFKVKEKAFTVPQLLKINMVYMQAWQLKNSTQQVFTIATHSQKAS